MALYVASHYKVILYCIHIIFFSSGSITVRSFLFTQIIFLGPEFTKWPAVVVRCAGPPHFLSPATCSPHAELTTWGPRCGAGKTLQTPSWNESEGHSFESKPLWQISPNKSRGTSSTKSAIPNSLHRQFQSLWKKMVVACILSFQLSCWPTWLTVVVSSVPQVCLEGEISQQSILNSLSRGKKASGDLIPWTVSEQVHTGHKSFDKIFTAQVSKHE